MARAGQDGCDRPSPYTDITVTVTETTKVLLTAMLT